VDRRNKFEEDDLRCTLTNGDEGVGFSDATRAVWVTRIVAWRRRSAQAGNRGVGLGGSVVSMGICRVWVLWIRLDRLVAQGIFGKTPHEFSEFWSICAASHRCHQLPPLRYLDLRMTVGPQAV
jgi:hypothetical protein